MFCLLASGEWLGGRLFTDRLGLWMLREWGGWALVSATPVHSN